MKNIGIDIGTTTISGVVWDSESGCVLHSVTKAHNSFIKTENAWERIQDTGILFPCAKAVLDGLLADYPDVSAIGMTGQMHGIVYTDSFGKPIGPLYTWQDGRGGVKSNGQSLTEEVLEKYGIAVPTGYGLMTHLYQQKHGDVPGNAAGFATAADCFSMLLTGRRHAKMHTSNCAGLGFFDGEHACFRTDILNELGLEMALLPEIEENFVELGSYRDIPVTVAIGDNQAAYLGAVGMCPGAVFVNMGTGGQISMLSPRFFEADGIEARPFLPGCYLLSGSSLCGGRAYAILERFMRGCVQVATGNEQSMYSVMAQLAEEGIGESDRMRVVTAFNGTRSKPALRGSISNLSENNFTPAGLVYGCLEGMARELYEMYLPILEGCNLQAEQLIGSGNGLRKNPVLQRIFGQLFGMDLKLAQYEEEAAVGAATAAMR